MTFESLIVGSILCLVGGLNVVRPDLFVRWQVWSQQAILGAHYIPSTRTYRAVRIFGALFLVLGLIAITGAFDMGGSSGDPQQSGEPVFCTADAKLCPDGSYVGRVGPNCEFAQCPATRAVSLSYYSPVRDQDPSGNILCSRQGLIEVQRVIPATNTPIQDAIRLLLRGELTEAERAQGVTTEYPLPGLSLTGASLENGLLTLTFADPENRTGGGSCRVGILWFQIEATARQFPNVEEVRFLPEELFQP